MEYQPERRANWETVEKIVKQWRQWAIDTNTTKMIVGISGGKDSTVAAALAADVFGANNVWGIMMPNGVQSDIDDAIAVVNLLGINSMTVNIEPAVKAISNSIITQMHKENFNGNVDTLSEQTKINLPARVRMTTLYAIGQTLGAKVICTDNASESYIGYSTMFGDNAGAYAPLKGLYATEVMELARYLYIPRKLSHKTPSDGLCGKTDEDNLGFTYYDLDSYLFDKEKGMEYLPLKTIIKIEQMHERNRFKTEVLDIPGPVFKESTAIPF